MTAKTITITTEAHDAIKHLKKPDESFSELFLRISRKKITIKNIAGILKESDIEKRFWDLRKKLDKGMEKRMHDLRS
ncbi:MAG: antitoxin VapB family protein [Candidatus Woesearchaeota archaeon]